MRQIVLDTETTGLLTTEGHRIIEIGCIELFNRKFTGKRFHQYINPKRAIDTAALAVHGITNDFLEMKPAFEDIAQQLMDFIQGAELIIHNAPFDVGFINYELALTANNWKPLAEYCGIIDTLVLARQLHVGQRNSLDALCKRYSIDNSQRELHGALLDAHLLAQLYLVMTGGQGSLFEEEPQKARDQLAQTGNKLAPVERSWNVPTLKASSEELALHQKYLQEVFTQAKPAWALLEKTN